MVNIWYTMVVYHMYTMVNMWYTTIGIPWYTMNIPVTFHHGTTMVYCTQVLPQIYHGAFS